MATSPKVALKQQPKVQIPHTKMKIEISTKSSVEKVCHLMGCFFAGSDTGRNSNPAMGSSSYKKSRNLLVQTHAEILHSSNVSDWKLR
jgi:hypothetical protein